MKKATIVQRLFIAALLASIVFLGVVYGMAAHKLQLWPYWLFRDSYMSAKALYSRIKPFEPPYFRTHHKNIGISRYNKEKAYNGLTLFTSSHAQKAFLISMEGQIMHEWHLPFSKVWSNPPQTQFPASDDQIRFRKAHLYPNGDLLAIYTTTRDTPWGYGLVKMDKGSKTIWKYAERVHHDVEVGSDGKIYTLIHEIVTDKIPGINAKPPMIEDSLVVLSPNGQELKKLSITEVFRHSDFSGVLKLLEPDQKGDVWHTNSVEVLDEQLADRFTFLEKGQVLVSMRNIDIIAAVDIDKERVVWAIRGPWHRQHDPDFLPNGNMLIFDNRGYYNKGGLSRVIEFNPTTMEIIWQYTGNEKDIFYSWAKSSQQRLSNGNTLITESNAGRIFEVTRDKEVVWEFMSPFRNPDDNEFVAPIFWAQRFRLDFLNFEFSTLNQNSP